MTKKLLNDQGIFFSDDDMSIDEAAVTWRVLLDDVDTTDEDRRNFTKWLAKDVRHSQAWREVESLWIGIDGFNADELTGHASPIKPNNSYWWRQVAASIVVFFMIGSIGVYFSAQPSGYGKGLFADYRTSVGEQKIITLTDGTEVTLGALSALSVSYDNNKGQRRVTLHHGEGYFKVMKDEVHPFIVTAGGGEIKVIGTEFNIKHTLKQNGSHLVNVAVSSGIVRVAIKNNEQNLIDLTIGQSVSFDQEYLGLAYKINTENIGFWRQGRMIFQSVPLNEVLYDLERYHTGRIIILDDKIASLPVTGIFNTKNSKAVLDVISKTLPVEIIQVTDYLTLITLKK